MKQNTLPGVVGIKIIRCSQLPAHVMQMSMCGATITLAQPAVSLKFYGSPSLKWEGTIVNGARQELTTLEFASPDIIKEGERYAFVITVASGKQYLIGSREPRFPVIEYTETAGSPDGDAALRSYKITHIAQKSVLECIL